MAIWPSVIEKDERNIERIYDIPSKLLENRIILLYGSIDDSMAAFLLCSGAKGKRFVLPNSEVMIHQPLGGAQGQATDIQIVAKNIQRTKERLYNIIAANTGKTYDEIYDACERDNYLTAQEAVDFGLVDIILKRKEEADV